ncbi:MAG: TetR/AcrR family transcriptional regulator [Pseudomonadota bacterium]
MTTNVGIVNMDGAADHATAYHHGNLREVLIERATATIHEKGVAALSLRALAREIGVSHAAPMRHFPTRDALLAAIAQHGITSLLKSATRQVDNDDLTSLEKLQAMAIGYVTWANANPVQHLLIRNQDVMRHADDTLRNQINTYARLHEGIIARAQKEGWRSEEPARSIFVQLTALTAGLALVASDPIYETVFQGHPGKHEIRKAIAEFFAKSAE